MSSWPKTMIVHNEREPNEESLAVQASPEGDGSVVLTLARSWWTKTFRLSLGETRFLHKWLTKHIKDASDD